LLTIDRLWQGSETTFVGASTDVGQSVQKTTNGGYTISGLTHSNE